jgi:hypothetical protein
MRAGLRSYVTAGVAVVGVSVIAVAPIAATPPDVKIANPGVQLSANPFQEYIEALQRALENAQLLFDEFFSEPVPIAEEWRFTGLLAGLLKDPDADVAEFVQTFGQNPASLNGQLKLLTETPPGPLQNVADLLAVGNIQDAVNALLHYSSSLLALPALRSAVGPVNSGLSASAAVAQEVLNALNSGDPQRVLRAIIAAPAVVADGVLNGHSGFTGLRDLGDAAREFLTPQPEMLTGLKTAATSERLVTLDLDSNSGLRQEPASTGSVGLATGEKQPDLTSQHSKDADEGTNQGVMAADEVTDQQGGNQHRPRSTGANSAFQNGGGPGLSSLRQGLRDGIREFRQGVRDAVKTFTGRGDHTEPAGDDAGESP